MRSLMIGVLAVTWLACNQAPRPERLVLDLDLEADVLSLSHAIDGFFFPPTVNRSPFSDRDLNAAFSGETLRNHLAATVLVRIGGEVAGFATEQEAVVPPAESQKPSADSVWLITLSRPGLRGVLVAEQHEDASQVFELAQRVARQPDADWEDRAQRFLSTAGDAHVRLATDDLAVYEGGIFEEYDFLNPADLKRLKRFRGAIQFVIYPRGAARAEAPAP
jgi:hypothetical protein